MLRQIMSNEWTAAMFGIVLLAAHVIWFLGSRHQAEVISGLGGAVTVLGILVAAQPYIRKGVRQAGREQAGLETRSLIADSVTASMKPPKPRASGTF